MKKYLNTLFVTTQGAYLSKEGETIAVKKRVDADKGNMELHISFKCLLPVIRF